VVDSRFPMSMTRRACTLLAAAGFLAAAHAAPPIGYYREPAIRGDTIVFVAEGDLWKVPVAGGTATRLTSHPGEEGDPAISPDGATVAFTATYEGPTEVYTMPLAGGLPVRRTWGGGRVSVVGFVPDGRLAWSTDRYSTLPSSQMVLLDVSDERTGAPEPVPLAEADDGCWDEGGRTLFFARRRFQGSHTKRYKGGTAQNLWRFSAGDREAVPLTADYTGTSRQPMCWNGRIYFASDRDGTMNLWSMAPDGSDLQQHTRHVGWDVLSPALDAGRIVYQLGSDLRLQDLDSGDNHVVPITLDSDLDQTREHWIDEPMDWVTSVHLAPDGGRIALTARGKVFVAPVKQGRLVDATPEPGVRHRDARFMPDGKSLLSLADASGEVELWTRPADGVGEATRLTDDGDVLRWEALPSPDGKRIAHRDKNQRLWIYDVGTGENREIDHSEIDDLSGLTWSADSRFLAYVARADNMFATVRIWSAKTGKVSTVTTDRFDSYDPAFSRDGKWLYLLSDRNLDSMVGSPWGNYQPEPFLAKKTLLYQIALKPGERSPFAPDDELHAAESKNDDEDKDDKKPKKKDKPADVTIDFDGIAARLTQLPVPAGDLFGLSVNDDTLFWLERGLDERKVALRALKIGNDKPDIQTVAEDVRGYELSADGKKILLRKRDRLYVVKAKAAKADLDKAQVDLSAWRLSVIPRDEWRQMFEEAWRLERDYFYDRGMHGVDWPAMREKYRPLVDRVTSRAELSDLLGQMVSELSALHIFVRGGDLREGPDEIETASLGARLSRDDDAGGYRVEHVYQADPDEVERQSPLARPGVEVADGDVIETINAIPTLSVDDPAKLLRNQAGQQTRLRVRRGEDSRDVIAVPMTLRDEADLRYHEWEYTRRLETDRLGNGDIGYVHLRAMGGDNFTEWAKGYYPVFTRKGLIIDVRHNRGGNIDSWILNRLIRKVWFDWSQRVGHPPSWNMQYAFRGHLVVLCDAWTASDGEAFSEGFRRLGLGPVIGTRTWGGEIWLSSSNFLVDRGIATAAEYGVYGPEGEWLIEGRGVEPDILVDNLPHATFGGQDAQLEAAVRYLQRKIEEEPVEFPEPPPYPDKSLH